MNVSGAGADSDGRNVCDQNNVELGLLFHNAVRSIDTVIKDYHESLCLALTKYSVVYCCG